ncbi:hypothetical protein Henu3_gp94 [Mycobacterium phage Henu3 PeY-2017]|nr:hypothetical protein Henu3_gp94 [Mycobacterium phage Henu3 PeY-2017]
MLRSVVRPVLRSRCRFRCGWAALDRRSSRRARAASSIGAVHRPAVLACGHADCGVLMFRPGHREGGRLRERGHDRQHPRLVGSSFLDRLNIGWRGGPLAGVGVHEHFPVNFNVDHCSAAFCNAFAGTTTSLLALSMVIDRTGWPVGVVRMLMTRCPVGASAACWRSCSCSSRVRIT